MTLRAWMPETEKKRRKNVQLPRGFAAKRQRSSLKYRCYQARQRRRQATSPSDRTDDSWHKRQAS
jgi:hypothetical protein